MYAEKKTAFLALVALAALLLAVPLFAQTDDGPIHQGWNPAGTWIETSVEIGEPPFISTIAPLGRGRTKYAIVSEILRDFGFGSVNYTTYRGVATRISYNTYEFSMICYATDAADQVVVFNVASGTTVFTDCDHFEATATVALYSPDQDPFGEEPPFYGCIPISHTFRRVPVVPTCEP